MLINFTITMNAHVCATQCGQWVNNANNKFNSKTKKKWKNRSHLTFRAIIRIICQSNHIEDRTIEACESSICARHKRMSSARAHKNIELVFQPKMNFWINRNYKMTLQARGDCEENGHATHQNVMNCDVLSAETTANIVQLFVVVCRNSSRSFDIRVPNRRTRVDSTHVSLAFHEKAAALLASFFVEFVDAINANAYKFNIKHTSQLMNDEREKMLKVLVNFICFH